MTQQELADKVFVTRQTISKWELGKSEPDNVSLELLFKEMNIEKESQKDIKANLISRKNILLIIIAVLFSPSILIIRLLVLKIGKIENKRLVILINTFLFIIIGIYMKSLKDNVYFGFLGVIAIAYSLYSFYKLSLEIKKRLEYIAIHLNIKKLVLLILNCPQKCDRKNLTFGASFFSSFVSFHEISCHLSTSGSLKKFSLISDLIFIRPD